MKRMAFTLAEVLITLGIIGVVAAITLPTLINNYQKMVWVNQLKKSISIVENGFKLAMAEDEVDNLKDTRLFQIIENDSITMNEPLFNKFSEEMGKYFKIVDKQFNIDYVAGYKTLSGNIYQEGDGEPSSIIYLADGSKLFLTLGNWGISYGPMGNIMIDVNGDKKPNTMGRDYFSFVLMPNGKLILDVAAENCIEYGYGCAARIIENGWKMDY